MDHKENRKVRTDTIMHMIQHNSLKDKSTNEEILISQICISLGAGRRYIKEIIQDLINTEKIVRFVGELYTSKHYKKIKDDLRRKNVKYK